MLRSNGLWLTALVALNGCGSTVVIEDGDGTPCFPEVHIAPGQEEVDLRVASPGTFVGELLHLDAIVDGERRYVVLQIDAGTAFVVGEPALDGRSELGHLGGSRYVRAANDATDGVRIDVIDVTDPIDPFLAASNFLDGAMPPALDGAIAAHDDHTYYCRTGEDGRADLVSLDLANPSVPGPLAVLDEVACELDIDHAASSGSLWLQWAPGEGNEMSSVYGYELTPSSMTRVVDFGFNPSGVHNYGRAERAATDGTRMVVDTANNWILVYDSKGNVSPEGPYQVFPLGGPKRLLAVADQLAYFAMADGIHALDVSSLAASTATNFVADTGVAPEELSLVAVGRTYLAVADGDGRLYLVDRSRSGPVPPARAFLGPPAETESHPGGC